MSRADLRHSMLDDLRTFDALRDGDEVAAETLEAIAPTYDGGHVFDRLSPKLIDALRKRGIDHLYQHQAEAILKALDGKNVVLQAPTASGKSLAFQVPMIEILIHDGSTAARSCSTQPRHWRSISRGQTLIAFRSMSGLSQIRVMVVPRRQTSRAAQAPQRELPPKHSHHQPGHAP